jgi:parvulin-like peptidyl-prolyl isomerase
MLNFMRKKVKVIIISVAVVFVVSVFYGLGSMRFAGGGDKKNRPMATVNGMAVDPLRLNQIFSRMISQFPQGLAPQDMLYFQNVALDQAIDFTLLLNEAKKRRVGVSGQEIDQAIESMMKSSGITSMQQLIAALKRSGLDLDTFKKVIKDEMMVQKLVSSIRSEAKITSDDLREVSARHILIRIPPVVVSGEASQKQQQKLAEESAQKQAAEILARLQKGENFADLARQYSADPGSAKNGGALGYFTKGAMVPEFDEAVFSLKVGQISGIVKTEFGYHIIKLEDSRLRKFKETGKDIETQALEEKQQRTFMQWFAGVKKTAKIEILDPVLKGNRARLSGNINEAVTLFLRAISENPTNPYLHILLGDTYAMLGQADLQLKEYQKAVELNPGDASLHIMLAKFYEKLAKSGETAKNRLLSLEEYKRASTVAGDNKTLRQELAEIFGRLGQYQLRQTELKEISRIEKKEKFEEEIRVRSSGEAR